MSLVIEAGPAELQVCSGFMNPLIPLQTIGRILSPNGTGRAPLFKPDTSWEEIVAVSSLHLVTPALTPALINKGTFSGLDADLKQYLTYIHDLNVQRNTALMTQAGEISRVLNGIGIIPIMLKGMAYLFSGLHGDIGARIVGDIDCLIPEERAEEALKQLESEGYTFPWAGHPLGHHHLPPAAREGSPAVVELHTCPIKRDFAVLLSANTLTRDMGYVDLEACTIGIPSPTHQVLICIEHEGLANRDDDFLRVSLRGLHDLACLVARHDIDWDEVIRRLYSAGLGGIMKRYLALARGFFYVSPNGLPVPNHLPLFLRAALRYPRIRQPLVILSLAVRGVLEKRVRKAALTYTRKVIRGEESLAPLKRLMANRE